tara:strand:- start:1250 stop:1495 length:246 start_codon:yes stop_codon:yes gene_type:complete
MIIPVRCFTCGKVLADKWADFVKKRKAIEKDEKNKDNIKMSETALAFGESNGCNEILEKYGLNRLCCRRHMLGHVDLIEQI